MSEKHINKSPIPCEVKSKSPILRDAESKSPLLQREGRLGGGMIGYKQTSIGIIPQDWEQFELRDIISIDSTKFNTENSKSQPCIELEHLSQDTGQILGFAESKNQKSIKNSFKKGQILFGKLRPYLRKFWRAEFDGVCSSEIWVMSGKKISNDFLFYLIQADKFAQIANVSTGTKMPRADWDYMQEIPFSIPPLKEQEKIARILSVWDSALDTLANLIKAKRKYKTALMQRLLTPPKDIDCHESLCDSHNDDKYCHTTSPCHTEGVARSIQKENLQGNAVCLDSSVATLPQNDKEISPQNDKENPRNDKTMDCHENPYGFSRNDNSPPRHTTSHFHTNSPLCHTERSEVSKSKGVDFVDTSAFSKPQYDKVLDSCNASPPCHCKEALATKQSTNESLRFAGFSDKWQEFRLGDLLKEKNTRNTNNVNLVLSVTNKQGFVTQKDYFEQEVASNDTSNYKVVCRGEFAYNPARINVGSIAMLENFENGILSPMYIVFECLEKINKDFFRYWLESHNFRGILGRYLSGSVRETLSFNDMKTMKIFIPTLAEQKKIAQVLSACDKEIETLNLKFECLKAQKKGLIQQLLSGSVRVKC